MTTFCIKYLTPARRERTATIEAETPTDASDRFVETTGNDFSCIIDITPA